MRQFIALNRDFDDLGVVAAQKKDQIQHDFDRDYGADANVDHAGLIVHLGGFRYEGNVAVPAMHLISNVSLDNEKGYSEPVRDFKGPSDELRKIAEASGMKRPADYKPLIEFFYANETLVWFNNGAGLRAFNEMKKALWQTLNLLRREGVLGLTATPSLEDHIAYCRMAVELFGSFFRHHFMPRHRVVGGGADAEWVPWPNA